MRNKRFTILSIAIKVFIFFQSALNSDLSSAESGVIVDLVMKVMEDVLPVGRQAIVFAAPVRYRKVRRSGPQSGS